MRSYRSTGTSALKQVFDGYIEDSYTDEQIRRILEPVLRLIKQGAFDRPRMFLIFWKRKKKRA